MSADDRVAKEREALLGLAALDDAELDSSDHERIWEAAMGRLPSAETARWLDRAGECPAIAESWRLALTLRRETEDADAPRSEAAARAMPRWTVLAAAALVLLTLVPSLWQRVPPPYRGSEDPIVSLLDEEQAVPRDRFVLRWAPAAGEGWTYSLTVTSSELDALVTEPELDTTVYQVPESVLSGIPDDDLVYWRVEAKNAGGEARSSQTFITRIR